MRIPTLLLLLCATACTRVDVNHHAVLPAAGLERVEAGVERGSITWLGEAQGATIDVDVWSWAAAAGEKRALGVEESNTWGVQVEDGVAELWGLSPSGRAGVDFAALGPGRVDVDAVSLEGEVWVESLTGSATITADSVIARDIRGSADLFAWGGLIDAVIRPSPGDLVLIHSMVGDVSLGLPAGLDYDLVIEVPPAYGLDVADLEFDRYASWPGRFEATRGDQSITIRVVLEQGSALVYEVGG